LVISQRYPYVEVQFSARGIQVQDFAYLDTGFDGFLIAPHAIMVTLGKPDLVSTWELGDGSLTAGADYLGEIEILGTSLPIRGQITCLGKDWVLGLGVLNLFEAIFDHGLKVEIRQ
jgi:predicted aspartyl protease